MERILLPWNLILWHVSPRLVFGNFFPKGKLKIEFSHSNTVLQLNTNSLPTQFIQIFRSWSNHGESKQFQWRQHITHHSLLHLFSMWQTMQFPRHCHLSLSLPLAPIFSLCNQHFSMLRILLLPCPKLQYIFPDLFNLISPQYRMPFIPTPKAIFATYLVISTC